MIFCYRGADNSAQGECTKPTWIYRKEACKHALTYCRIKLLVRQFFHLKILTKSVCILELYYKQTSYNHSESQNLSLTVTYEETTVIEQKKTLALLLRALQRLIGKYCWRSSLQRRTGWWRKLLHCETPQDFARWTRGNSEENTVKFSTNRSQYF